MDYDVLYTAMSFGVMLISSLISLAISILTIIGTWKVYAKADKPGWASLVPFYTAYCMYDITWGSGWLFLVTFVPIAGVIFSIITRFKLAKAFGRGTGFGFGLLFLNAIFMMILGFGDSEYVGPQ